MSQEPRARSHRLLGEIGRAPSERMARAKSTVGKPIAGSIVFHNSRFHLRFSARYDRGLHRAFLRFERNEHASSAWVKWNYRQNPHLHCMPNSDQTRRQAHPSPATNPRPPATLPLPRHLGVKTAQNLHDNLLDRSRSIRLGSILE